MTDEEKAVKYCYENVTIYEAEKHNKLVNKVKRAYLDGLEEGRKIALKELVERVEKDQSERQVQTINVIELKVTIEEMGVDL